MSHGHIESARLAWSPELRRRQQIRIKDADVLHWDRLPPILRGEAMDNRCFVVTYQDQVQGVLFLQPTPAASRITPRATLLYLRYLATAPWNRPETDRPGRFRGTGTMLLVQAVRESVACGCSGRVGLHALSGSESFYRKLGFHDLGPDPSQRGMNYFEIDIPQANCLLARSTREPES
jgi:hypothetical protein